MNSKSVNIFRSVIIILGFGCVQNNENIKSADINVPDPDIELDSLQLIAKYGGSTPQKHSVVTEDGYIVNLFRIPNKGPAVLMVHGIGDSSDSWLVTSPSSSLAFQLSELGYDIWLYNARGNKYSRGHVKNIPKKQYWNFSYEEMGSMDLPASIDYILSLTNQPKLYYVGFSQGTTMFFVMGSMRPEYNDKIKQAIILGPVSRLDNIKFPYMNFFANNIQVLKLFFDGIGVYDLFNNNVLLKWFHANVCQEGSPERIFCELEYALTFGVKNFTNLNVKQLPVITTHIPSGVSTKTFEHIFQIYSSKRFQRFDFGRKKNMALYSSAKPPEFNVSLITVPIHIFVSDSDWYSTVEDTERIRTMLPNIVSYVVFNKSLDFTHLEFVYGKRSQFFINDPVKGILLGDLYKL